MIRKNKKFDEEFVRKNHDKIIEESEKNAKEHYDIAGLLLDSKHYSSSVFHCITSLEEFAKSSLIKKKKYSEIEKLNHAVKGIEIANLSGQCYDIPKITENEYIWARDRFPQMREDSIYVRLKETPENKIRPDNNYWRKRAKSLYRFLTDLIKIKKKI